MIRLYFFLLAILFICSACGDPKPEMDQAEEPPIENWIPLFNGKDLSGWEIKFSGEDLDANYLNTFAWEDDMLRIKYDEYDAFNDKFAHLYYHQPYSRYKLRFDYRFTGEQTPGGSVWNVRNSGVMLHSESAASNAFDQNFPVSIELQLLGGLSDGKPRPTGNLCTPATAVVMGDTLNYNHCISSTSKTYNGDEWVHAEAVVLGGEAMHFLIEGDTVLSFTQPQIGGWPAGGKQLESWGVPLDKWLPREGEILTGGYIALQAESHAIDFRNVELLELPE